MPELKYQQMVVFNHGPTTAEFRIDNQKVSVVLTEGEHAEILALCYRAYDRNRAALADAIRTAQPALLTHVPDAEWDEVPIDLP